MNVARVEASLSLRVSYIVGPSFRRLHKRRKEGSVPLAIRSLHRLGRIEYDLRSLLAVVQERSVFFRVLPWSSVVLNGRVLQ